MRILLPLSIGTLILLWWAWTALQAPPSTLRRVPPFEWRLAAGILGVAWGWLMANLSYAPDVLHRVVGFPFPVCQWVKAQGAWADQTSPVNPVFLVLDILVHCLLATRFLHFVWGRRQPIKRRAS